MHCSSPPLSDAWRFLTLIVLTTLPFHSGCERSPLTGAGDLDVLCAAALRVPVEQAAKSYEAAGLGSVRLQFGGSQAMLSTLEIAQKGDLFLAADISYIELANSKNLLAETISLARMKAVVAVATGNPKKVLTMQDLTNKDLRLILANPELSAISQLTASALPSETWRYLTTRAIALKPTVNDVANDIMLGAADAGIVWDVTVAQTNGLEAITIPELTNVTGQAAGAVAATSTRPTAALQFLRWLAAPDKGGAIFSKNGYATNSGDPWTETPVLTLMAGAMLRPAIEPALVDFEKREGCRVDRIYNGCGILVGQMKAAAPSDMFFACDRTFMHQVVDLFPDPQEVTSNRLVILVAKGNPHNIRKLEDLGKAGLKIGVGHEKQCALGVITTTTLTKSGFRESVMRNVVVQAPTGDLLVNQLLAGGLDAALTYVSNAAGSADKLDAIGIPLSCAIASQSMAIARGTTRPQLAGRLLRALGSQLSRQRFEALGFNWIHPAQPAE